MSVLWGCKIFTGAAENGVIEFGYVEFSNGVITRVSALAPGSPAPVFSEEILDGRGLTALPGYIDCECHFVQDSGPSAFKRMMEGTLSEAMFTTMRNAERFLRMGFTTVRDMGDKNYETLLMRDKIRDKKAMGPRILATGKAIRVTKGHFAGYEIDGPYEARRAVREHLSHKSDWVKLIASSSSVISTQYEAGATQMLYDEMDAICTVARNYGVPVAAHAHSVETISNCLRAGVKTIEHCTSMTPEVVDLLLEKDAWAVTTFTPYAAMCVDESGLTSPMMKEYSQRVMEIKTKYFADAVKAGVNIAFGTDSGAPLTYHGNSAYEIENLVKYGMTMGQALAAMTSTAARLLGLDDRIGWLKEGYTADITVVNGDPYQKLSALEDTAYVFQGGELVCRDGCLLDKNTAPLYTPPCIL